MAAAGRPRFLRQTTPHPVHGVPPTAAAAAQSVPTPLGGSQAPVGGSSGGGEHAALWHARQASPEQSIDGDLPYCEQLAAAGDWRPQPVDMEASYEGITELNPHECARQLEDRLPRWPDFTTGGVLRFGDYLGTVTFSMTGTLTALGAGMDVLGGCVVGTITAVGGGTIRDVLIARDENGHSKRAFWMDEPEYLYISLVSSLVTFYYWNELAEAWQLDQSDAWIFWLDSLGIAAFCSIGCMHGIRAGLPWVVCALCGMMTSTFGGMTRDVLTHRPVRILHSHSEIYALTAFSGATAYLAARALGFSYAARATAAFCTAVGLRCVACTSDRCVCLSVCLSCLFVCLCICLSICLSAICISIYLSIHPSIHPPIHLSIDRSIHPSVQLSIYLSISRGLQTPNCWRTHTHTHAHTHTHTQVPGVDFRYQTASPGLYLQRARTRTLERQPRR